LLERVVDRGDDDADADVVYVDVMEGASASRSALTEDIQSRQERSLVAAVSRGLAHRREDGRAERRLSRHPADPQQAKRIDVSREEERLLLPPAGPAKISEDGSSDSAKVTASRSRSSAFSGRPKYGMSSMWRHFSRGISRKNASRSVQISSVIGSLVRPTRSMGRMCPSTARMTLVVEVDAHPERRGRAALGIGRA